MEKEVNRVRHCDQCYEFYEAGTIGSSVLIDYREILGKRAALTGYYCSMDCFERWRRGDAPCLRRKREVATEVPVA